MYYSFLQSKVVYYDSFPIFFLRERVHAFVWWVVEGAVGGRQRDKEVNLNRLPTEHRALEGLYLMTLRRWPEPNSRVGHLTHNHPAAPFFHSYKIICSPGISDGFFIRSSTVCPFHIWKGFQAPGHSIYSSKNRKLSIFYFNCSIVLHFHFRGFLNCSRR